MLGFGGSCVLWEWTWQYTGMGRVGHVLARRRLPESTSTNAALPSTTLFWFHSLAHSRFRCSCSATRTTEQDTDEGRQGHTVAHTVMHERSIAMAAVRSILTC